MEEKKTCHFYCTNGFCRVLSETRCDGERPGCTFYKTRKQYLQDLDDAIMLNRKRGNCSKCKYRENRCMLAKEV